MSAISSEIERFNRLCTTWWNSTGPMRPLHVVNALRLGCVVGRIESHFGLSRGSSLAGLRILVVGCGGGLLSEPLARDVAPRGLLFASTIDRIWKSFVFAIVGAEYILRVLPRGTHQWRRFVRPTELAAAVGRAGLQQTDLRGIRYLPVLHQASWCRDTRVNYMAAFACGAQAPTQP